MIETVTMPKPRGVESITVITMLVSLAFGSITLGQTASRDEDPVRQAWEKNPEVMVCDQCHYAPQTAGLQKLDTAYSRQNELSFWLANDKHAIARRRVQPLTEDEVRVEAKKLLEQLKPLRDKVNLRETILGWLGTSNTLSRRICDNLGYEVNNPSDTRFRDNCLTCHGGYRNDIPTDAVHFSAGQPGISCTHCHQDGINETWVGLHGLRNKREQWRLSQPAQKQTLGMRDLTTTSKQADLCFDCHIGNRKQNQFVTHAMYAAGHPPLPSIELQTFCQQMPQHWRSAGEVGNDVSEPVKSQFFLSNYPGITSPDETCWDTRKIMIGALAARKKNLDLLIDSSEMNRWADYSLYDCSACHHELRSESRRQARGYHSAPGRPRQHEWANLQLMHASRFLSDNETTIVQLERQLKDSFSAQPFGDERRVVDHALALRTQIEQAIEQGEKRPIDHQTARQFLHLLASTPVDQIITYDSARQVVWAMQAISSELQSKGHGLTPNIEQLIAQLDQPTIGDGNTGIATQLPSGRTQFIYEQGLKEDLERRAAFDPDLLKSRLQEIDEALTVESK